MNNSLNITTSIIIVRSLKTLLYLGARAGSIMLLTFRQYAGAGSKKAQPPKVNKIPMHSEFEGLAKTGMLLPSRMCRRREILIRLSSQRKSGGIFSIDE